MNERIRELIAEADRKCSETRGIYDEILAELIVRECVNNLEIHSTCFDGDVGRGIKTAARLTKEHFKDEERKGWVCPKCGVDRTREACPKGHFATMTGDCPMTATAQSGVEE